MDGYRLALAEDGLRRGFELLAAALEGRSTQAEALRRKADEYRDSGGNDSAASVAQKG
jgi:hypothetical protein